MEWLFRSEFDTGTAAALWSVIGVSVTTVILFVYTMGLRAAHIWAGHARTRLLERWREIFASAILYAHAADSQELPSIERGQDVALLEEWNRARASVEGSAASNLIVLANRIGLPAVAERLFRSRRIKARILAVHTFGHLRDRRQRDTVRFLVDDPVASLSITAAVALTDIDPDFAIPVLVPMIEKRRDWPRTRVSVFLRMAGSERISEPLFRAVRSADNDGKTYLLQFAQLVDASVLDALIEELIRESRHAGVLNAALKLVSGQNSIPRIASLTRHEAWFVRMQAAKALGRIGQEEQLPLLESLLNDREWWVRYRAAQSIASLPFLGPNRLRRIRMSQSDGFAADILQQAYAEVGLA